MPQDRYSHGHAESVLRAHRWRTATNSAAFLLGELEPSSRVLDAGCGPGTVTADLARFVPDGSIVGLDQSHELVAQARIDFAGVENLAFEVGDVYALPYEDSSFDVVYAHQLLQHLSDPVAGLGEMRRVLRPGGLVAVRDGDYGAFAWWPPEPRLDRWIEIYHQLTSINGAFADAGRRLHAWVLDAGFVELKVSSSNWTFHSDADRAWWGNSWAERVEASEFASQSLEYKLTTPDELADIATAFRHWALDPRGNFIVVSGEVLARR